MTPHCHWMRNYVPKRVPIKLADDKTVYSAGEGTIVFNPIVNGKAVRPLEFSRVLHVPDLRNNLFSVLFLTRHKGFTVTLIQARCPFNNLLATLSLLPPLVTRMQHPWMTPLSIWQNMPLQPPHYLNLDLWQRRLAHHHFEGVKKLLEKKLVTGMTFNSSAAPVLVVWT